MHVSALATFISVNRDELIRRCRTKVARRDHPPTAAEIDHGVPLFLTQMVAQLEKTSPRTREITNSAKQHGRELFLKA